MGLSNSERLRKDANAVSYYLKWWWWWVCFRENRARFFSEVHKERTSGAVAGCNMVNSRWTKRNDVSLQG